MNTVLKIALLAAVGGLVAHFIANTIEKRDEYGKLTPIRFGEE